MTLWILDTDHVSLFQTNHPLVTQKVQSIEPNAIAVTIVTISSHSCASSAGWQFWYFDDLKPVALDYIQAIPVTQSPSHQCISHRLSRTF